jgi:peroxiredoxin
MIEIGMSSRSEAISKLQSSSGYRHPGLGGFQAIVNSEFTPAKGRVSEMSVSQGQKPPDFQLPDQDKNQRSLKDFLGKKTVLAFFPGAFTGVCTREMCSFRDSLKGFTSMNAQVVGISVNDPWTNKAFADMNKLTFPLLCDYSRETVRKFNLFHNDFAGLKGYTVAKRSVFILDAQGVVRYKWVSEDPGREPNYEEIKATLSKL